MLLSKVLNGESCMGIVQWVFVFGLYKFVSLELLNPWAFFVQLLLNLGPLINLG